MTMSPSEISPKPHRTYLNASARLLSLGEPMPTAMAINVNPTNNKSMDTRLAAVVGGEVLQALRAAGARKEAAPARTARREDLICELFIIEICNGKNCVYWHVSRYPTEVNFQSSIRNCSSASFIIALVGGDLGIGSRVAHNGIRCSCLKCEFERGAMGLAGFEPRFLLPSQTFVGLRKRAL